MTSATVLSSGKPIQIARMFVPIYYFTMFKLEHK